MTKKMIVKVFKMNGEIFGAYRRSSARKHFEINNQEYNGTFVNASYTDLLEAEKNIIDPGNKHYE